MTIDRINILDASGIPVSTKANDDGTGLAVPVHDVRTLPALPAGSNKIGLADLDPVQVILRGAIDFNTIADNQLVALATGKKIYLLGLILVASAIVGVTLKSNGVALTGLMKLAANVPFILPIREPGYAHVIGTISQNLQLALDGTIQTGGSLVYAQF